MSSGQEHRIAVAICIAILGLGCVLVLVAVALAFAGQAGLRWASGGSIVISIKMILLAFGAYLSASIAHLITRKHPRILFVAANTLLLLLLLGLFGFLLRNHAEPTWFLFAAVLVVAIQAGSYGFGVYRRRTVVRLLQERASEISANEFERPFKGHSVTYVALPLGVVVGTFAGAAANLPPPEIIRLCFILVFAAVGAGVLVFLAQGALHVAQSYVREAPVPQPRVGFDSKRRLAADVPPIVPDEPRSVQYGLDGVVIAGDLRRLFLLNQYQQLAVLTAVALACSALVQWEVPLTWIASAVLALGLLVIQGPYLMGQQRERSRILDRFIGTRREELRAQLVQYAPLTPNFQSWAALTASGTFGGFLAKLLEKTIEGLING